MQLAACVAAIVLAGCSSLLGITDPTAARDGGDDGADAQDHLMFSLGDVRIARDQVVRIHVALIQTDGSLRDVTSDATYSSDDPTIATGAPGTITGLASGAARITGRLGDAAPATLTVTVTSVRCHPVINELATGDPNGIPMTSAADEWVELYNPCSYTVNVDSWTLLYRAAMTSGNPQFLVALAGQMAPGDFRLYSGLGYPGTTDGTWPNSSGMLQQTSGAVALRAGPLDTDPIVDSVAYGAVTPGHPFIETNPTAPMAYGRSASRLPFDGRDDSDGPDDGDGATNFMVVTTETPRAPNAP